MSWYILNLPQKLTEKAILYKKNSKTLFKCSLVLC